MIIPKKLKKWDTIWIISPSAGVYPFFPHRFENAVKNLESMWFKAKFAKNSKNNAWYISDSIENRVVDIHEMFLDKEVKAIICSIWWNHSNQLLKYIDFDIIKNNPKIFVWYSDISVLHYAFLKKADLQTYYGPTLVAELWEYPEVFDYTKHYFLKILTEETTNLEIEKINYYTDELLNWVNKEDLTRKREFKDIEWFKILRWWESSWQIIGGCIPSINHLLWTDYWINPKDKIFFIDLPEWFCNLWEWMSVAELDSYLTDLDNVGIFENIKWLLVSVSYGHNDENKKIIEDMILKYVKNKNYPVIFNLPIGHTDPMLTIPLLSYVKIKDDLIVLENI